MNRLPLPGLGPVAGSNEQENAPLCAMKVGEYTDQLTDYQFLKDSLEFTGDQRKGV